jgi:hypothetical protein
MRGAIAARQATGRRRPIVHRPAEITNCRSKKSITEEWIIPPSCDAMAFASAGSCQKEIPGVAPVALALKTFDFERSTRNLGAGAEPQYRSGRAQFEASTAPAPPTFELIADSCRPLAESSAPKGESARLR